MSASSRILLGLLLAFISPSAARSQGRPAGEGLAGDLNPRSLPPARAPRGPHRMALCIGVNGPAGEGRLPLTCAVADAKDLGKALEAAGFDVTVMTDDADDALKPTRPNLDQRLTRFIRAADNPDDTLIIAFFGQGGEGGGPARLSSLDVRPQGPVPLAPLLDSLSRCLARKKLLVLDPCRSPTEKSAFGLTGDFLRSVGTPEDFLVFLGCAENQADYEDREAGHSRFTQLLLEGLASRKAFAKDHEFLLAEEWAGYLQATSRDRGWAELQSPKVLGHLAANIPFDIARRDLPKLPAVNDPERKRLAAAMQAAQAALARQDYLATVEAATSALQSDERATDAMSLRALAYVQLGYSDKALADADAALALDAENPIALQAKGLVEFNGSAYTAAGLRLSRASALVDAAPERWPVLAGGGVAADRWLRLGHLATRFDATADWSAAIRHFTRVVGEKGVTPVQVQEALVNRLGCLTRAGKAQLADADSTTLIRMKHVPPELTAKALICRGFSYGKQGKPELEASYYTTVLGMKDVPRDLVALALFNRGICNGELGKAESALADYNAVLQMNDAPVDRLAETLVNRGLLNLERGMPDLAVADFTSVIRMTQRSVDQLAKALVNRGVCYNRLGQAEQEIADYSNLIAIKNAPADERAGARIYRGIAYTRQGKPDLAIADYTAVVEMPRAPAEKVAAALGNRGWRYYASGHLDEAAADSRRAAEMNPGDPRPAYNLALILVRQGKFVEAYEAYRLALARAKPDDEPLADLVDLRDKLSGPPEAGVFIGWLALEAGQTGKATAELTAYLKQHPNGPLAAFARELLAPPRAAATIPK